MTEYLHQTEETAKLVDMGSLVPAEPGDAKGLQDEVEQLRQDQIDAAAEITALTNAYDQEVIDHTETAKRAFAAEEALIDMVHLYRNGVELSPNRLGEIGKLFAEVDMRVKAGREFAAKHAAK